MIFDSREDKRQLEQWLCEEEPQHLDHTLIATKIINGFEQCTDHCPSRNNCGSEGCYCVRANFPTPQHYEIYKQMLPNASKMVAVHILANAIDNHIKENYGKGN